MKTRIVLRDWAKDQAHATWKLVDVLLQKLFADGGDNGDNQKERKMNMKRIEMVEIKGLRKFWADGKPYRKMYNAKASGFVPCKSCGKDPKLAWEDSVEGAGWDFTVAECCRCATFCRRQGTNWEGLREWWNWLNSGEEVSLKPCPFCGSAAKIYVLEPNYMPGNEWRVTCAGCRVFQRSTDRLECFAQWNNRVDGKEMSQ